MLKGPQGTLFGASALNGALRYVLNEPEFGEWQAKLFGNGSRVELGGSGHGWGAAVNAPIGSSFALRGVAVSQKSPGLYDDVNANGKNQKDADTGGKFMWRAMGRWQPVEALTVQAFYLKQDQHRDALSFANNLHGDLVHTDTPGPQLSAQKFSVANLDARYSFSWGQLVSETSRSTKQQNLDIDGSAIVEDAATAGIESVRISTLDTSTALSQEVRLVSVPADLPWKWLAGIYFYRYDATALYDVYAANTGNVAVLVNDLGVENLPLLPLNLTPTDAGLNILSNHLDPLKAREDSVFGELTREFFDSRMQLTFGARLYRETLSAFETADGATKFYGDAIGASGQKDLKAKGFNPKLSGTVQITNSILGYATAAKGFQFGGLNLPAVLPQDNYFDLTYRPSTVWSYEAGVRTDWFERTLQLDVTGFLINWHDMQIQQRTADGSTTFTENIGSARAKGAEWAARWLTPLPGLMLTHSGSYVLSKVQEGYTSADGTFIPSGTDLPVAPHLQTATGLAWRSLPGIISTGAGITWSHQGPAFCNIKHERVVYDYNQLDLTASLGAPEWTGAPELTLNVTNLSDVRALAGTNTAGVGTGATSTNYGFYVRPRTFALRLTAQF